MSVRSLLAIVIIALDACTIVTEQSWSNCNTNDEAVIPLVVSSHDTLNLYLDSSMVMEMSTPVDYHAARHVLYAFDNYNKRLLTYHLGTKGLVYPDSIHHVKMNTKQKVSYMRYFSPDSLILYTYGGARLFYYALNSDKTYKSVAFINPDAPRLKGNGAAHPFANAASPMLFLGGRIIGAGFLLGEKEGEDASTRTIFSEMDLSSSNVGHHIPYSQVYWEHNWGGSHMRTPYTVYNEQKKEIILSLPVDHNIQIVDSSWKTRELYAGSRKSVCITSLELSKNSKRILDPEVALSYYTLMSSYRNIIYDKYHDRYYRILELFPDLDYEKVKKIKEDGVFMGKQTMLIAFDKKFNYLGENLLPDGLALDNFFVTPDGLHFLNANNKDQNIAQYVQFKIDI